MISEAASLYFALLLLHGEASVGAYQTLGRGNHSAHPLNPKASRHAPEGLLCLYHGQIVSVPF